MTSINSFPEPLRQKYNKLQSILQRLGSVAVAFSSGVDSTFLVKVAHDVLGDRAVAFTAASDFVPQRDQRCQSVLRERGHRAPYRAVPDPHGAACRGEPRGPLLLLQARAVRAHEGARGGAGLAAVVDGSNLDDDGDYRPGHKALKELAIVSPLHEAGMHKADIRALSRYSGCRPGTSRRLPAWPRASRTARR